MNKCCQCKNADNEKAFLFTNLIETYEIIWCSERKAYVRMDMRYSCFEHPLPKIKKCWNPNCFRKQNVELEELHGGSWVSCNWCGTKTPTRLTKEKAIKLHNKISDAVYGDEEGGEE